LISDASIELAAVQYRARVASGCVGERVAETSKEINSLEQNAAITSTAKKPPAAAV
jgi:hypothetical protein